MTPPVAMTLPVRRDHRRTGRPISRRAFIGGVAAWAVSLPAAARGRYRVVGVEVRPTPLVASRLVTDLPGRVAARIGCGGGGATPVRVVVELTTIDPYRGGRPTRPRAIAARYRIIDAATGRTLRADRFTERTTVRDDVVGSLAVLHVPRSQGAGERELADEVAGHVLRWGL